MSHSRFQNKGVCVLATLHPMIQDFVVMRLYEQAMLDNAHAKASAKARLAAATADPVAESSLSPSESLLDHVQSDSEHPANLGHVPPSGGSIRALGHALPEHSSEV